MAQPSGANAPPPIAGVLETGLYVDDVPRARSFYEGVLGLSPMVADERFCAYNAGPASVLLLFRRGATLEPLTLPGGVIPAHDGHGPLHFALAIPVDSLDPWIVHLAVKGIGIEGRVDWKGGGTSLYLRDPDGHLVELATPGLWANY
ncbi:catechol 2,3-dioxygenase-like lactoylglutathione lyase family enzyme [Angulomicrobium tetraedrale]|uniref:Catechol 2,3-dioxygenase-like lactoylglutathione lyase family enzyme n=1 Tax=Ancylobacter tetraedralis TaxID=217068 RepID=A0A839Z7C6_9HYPH|nr:VOC family protein [Ancylobacter tetraedralis]MBB3770346.1 catechol 2,3-dioxygenase-like lactoylglutathione lyase family enzyme [Ancylobacter tetraedralis]